MNRVLALTILGLLTLRSSAPAEPPRRLETRICAGRDRRLLWLKHLHRGDELQVRPFTARGIPCAAVWRSVTRFFRSRTDTRRTVHPRLLRTLVQLQRHFGGRRIELMSGFRARGDREPLTSYHQVGRAADISIVGIENRDLFEYCRALQRAGQPLGCGLYPRGSHVHVDVRSRPTIWVDLSGYHDGAAYVPDPHGWLDRHPAAGRKRP